ncbi:hypothetical protein BDC45DRAFT_114653 [Circinella umbellata]|nr:hypothetical protein BDC45DRAFT_114653 [Circinella umbellata]
MINEYITVKLFDKIFGLLYTYAHHFGYLECIQYERSDGETKLNFLIQLEFTGCSW